MRCEPVLPALSRLGADPDGHSGDARHHHRQPGRHNRRVLPHTPGRFSSGCCRGFGITHTSETMAGQIYLPRSQLDAAHRRAARRLRLPSSSSILLPPTACRSRLRWSSTRCWPSLSSGAVAWPLWQTALTDDPALIPRAGVPLGQHAEGRSRAAGCRCCWPADRPGHGHLGARLATLAEPTRKNEADLDWLVRKLEAKPPHRVPGTAVFLTGRCKRRPDLSDAQPEAQPRPPRAQHHLVHTTVETPRVPRHERVSRRSRLRHLHPRRRALRLHGDAEHSEDPRSTASART